MKEQTTPEERNGHGLTNDEIRAVRDMGEIRNAEHRPDHIRLHDFEKAQNAGKEVSMREPIVKEGQQVVINGKQITFGQDFVDALVEIYGDEPQLYGFETYEEKPQKADLDIADNDMDLER